MSARLDQIEAILQQTAQQQQANTTAISNLTERLDQLTERLDHLTEQGDALIGAVSGAFAEMRDDRIEWKAQAERDREVFQAEIRRIWEYLLGLQPGNGRNS